MRMMAFYILLRTVPDDAEAVPAEAVPAVPEPAAQPSSSRQGLGSTKNQLTQLQTFSLGVTHWVSQSGDGVKSFFNVQQLP